MKDIKEDVWIPTQCTRCYAYCAIRVRRVNGVAVEIEGEPNSKMGAEGGLCAKGLAGLQVLYDPNRLNVPLRRTNAEKGLFADPKWKEITWEEALDEIVPRLRKIISEAPQKLLIQNQIINSCNFWTIQIPFRSIIPGISRFQGGGGLHCGQGAHNVAGLVHASWSVVPDFKYCNYVIYFGTNKGTGSGHSAMITARLSAEARIRGMRVIAFDPMCNFGGGKATEWVPIIPGTDGAVALAMCNIIVNDLGLWDVTYLKTKTNAPYLIGPDKRYVRDKESSKPLVWDAAGGRARAYDDSSIGDYALDGNYQVNGVKCQPVFQLLRAHLKKYTPETASKVSTVPEKTIRRIATEFAQAAQVGSTITIGGHELPFRPASAVLFRGAEGHENSYHTCFAVSLLNQIVGAVDVPGGTLGWPARSLGHPATGKPSIPLSAGIDGFLVTEHFMPWAGIARHDGPWPPKMPENRHILDLTDIFPLAVSTFVFQSSDQEELWQKTGCPHRIEMIISYGLNSIMSVANRDAAAQALKKIPFIVVHELFNNELTEGFADIVLPGTCYLEETALGGFGGQTFNHPFGMEDWCLHIIQPVVKPMYQRKSFDDFLVELVERLGKREEFNNACNKFCDLDEDNKLKPAEIFTIEGLHNKIVKSLFGSEYDWEWFKKHGFLRWPKKVEEAYWRYFVDARVPIYLEYLLDIDGRMREIARQTGLEIDCSRYSPLIEWYPSSIHSVDKAGYDLYCFSYRDILHTGSHTIEQPWLDEASRMNPYTYNITINADTAKKMGLKDGDTIEIESVYGRKIRGTIKLMQGQHPQTIGIAACSGHWARGMPIARGKGTNYDQLMEIDLKHMDPICLNIETAVRVKVRKVDKG